MKHLTIILLLLVLSLSAVSQLDFYCNRDFSGIDSMNRAWYPYQIIDSIVFPNRHELIIADPNNKPTNFISSEEATYKSLASKGSWVENFFGESEADKKYKNMPSNRDGYWDSLATVEHIYANGMDMAVWIQNQTTDTLILPIQDGSVVAILEARDKEIGWQPIEYWWYSWCGNSFSIVNILPGQSIQIGVNINYGNKSTMMRLKIHGDGSFYYSNEFQGTVSDVKLILPIVVLQKKKDDPYRISFLDSIQHWLTVEPKIEIIEFENTEKH